MRHSHVIMIIVAALLLSGCAALRESYDETKSRLESADRMLCRPNGVYIEDCERKITQ